VITELTLLEWLKKRLNVAILGRNRTYTSALTNYSEADGHPALRRDAWAGGVMPLTSHPGTAPARLRKKAFKWLVALLYAENVLSVLPELNAWLRENKAHRVAFARARRTWRLAGPYLRATEQGAGRAEFRAFKDALKEDDFASPRDETPRGPSLPFHVDG
jgi:hypothetical protein